MKNANTAQRQWMNDITEWANDWLQLIYGDEYEGAVIQRHHVLGRSARHNKVDIGHWFILPVPFELHDVSSNHPENVTHRKKAFINRFGPQRKIFEFMHNHMESQGYNVPTEDVLYAIFDTSA